MIVLAVLMSVYANLEWIVLALELDHGVIVVLNKTVEIQDVASPALSIRFTTKLPLWALIIVI